MKLRLFETVEIPLAANTALQKLMLPDINQLRGRVVNNIEFVPAGICPYSPMGNPNIHGTGILRSTYMVLWVVKPGEQGEFVKLPVSKFYTAFSAYNTVSSLTKLGFGGAKVVWAKSYLWFPQGTVSAGAVTSLMYVVSYQ